MTEPAAGTPRALLGGVEAGGTKFVCLIARGPDEILARTRIDVTDPGATIAPAVDFFVRAAADGLAIEALGIGSFGPVVIDARQPDLGWITSTPKPGWSGTDLLGPFAKVLDVPIGFDTDVNAAALAEGRWGAARGLADYLYLTVGTGIGGGAVVNGSLVHGLGHPEMGHIPVPRAPDDAFEGACPFHGDCLEGMASGPAIAARFGRPAESLDPPERDRAVALLAWYLGAGISALVYALAPQRVIVGGGVASLPGLIAATGREVASRLERYPGVAAHGEPGFVVPPGTGDLAGPAGTLVLAERALADSLRTRPAGA